MNSWGETVVKPGISVFKRLKSITDPHLTPENWFEIQPCMNFKIASREILITQPTSTFFVYVLGIQTIVVGSYFLWIQNHEVSRLWWGISLLLWGIGALLAGTSYQAFGYQIKCANRSSCSWTSWWEVIYLMFQQVSMGAMLVAVAYSCTEGWLQQVLFGYAIIGSLIYICVALIGGLVPIQSLITFNGMVWFSTPILLIFLLLNSWRYYTLGTPIDFVLLEIWALLILTSIAYWFYDKYEITQKLWKQGRGIWFSQNDVLHIGLILWMSYIATAAQNIQDYPA